MVVKTKKRSGKSSIKSGRKSKKVMKSIKVMRGGMRKPPPTSNGKKITRNKFGRQAVRQRLGAPAPAPASTASKKSVMSVSNRYMYGPNAPHIPSVHAEKTHSEFLARASLPSSQFAGKAKAEKFKNVGIENFKLMITNPKVMGSAVVDTKNLSDFDIKRMYNSVQNIREPRVDLLTVRGAVRSLIGTTGSTTESTTPIILGREFNA